MSILSVGVFGTSSKENEHRVPIHPDQIDWIEEDLRNHLYFEKHYGEPFGGSDKELQSKSAGVLTREALFEECDIMLLPKPVQADFDSMREGSILWGWPHCVQQQGFTQSAIDKRMTLIAWEAMHRWSRHGDWQMHTFYKNNEMAGYCAVLHALSLVGIDGNYGPPRKAVVISFGSVSRGAIIALQGMGIHDITVFTKRYSTLVADQFTGVNYHHFEETEDKKLISLHPDRHSEPFIDELKQADIIVNGILQDTDHPLMFVTDDQVNDLKNGFLIIDVSCDEGMGFSFARPTSFNSPMFKVGKGNYYAVDHSPSYLWNSASWEISNSLLPYLPIIMKGPESWQQSETIRRAIEIEDGMIQNPKILSFQNREELYPHEVIQTEMENA
jgi:alanine dehydrogenase